MGYSPEYVPKTLLISNKEQIVKVAVIRTPVASISSETAKVYSSGLVSAITLKDNSNVAIAVINPEKTNVADVIDSMINAKSILPQVSIDIQGVISTPAMFANEYWYMGLDATGIIEALSKAIITSKQDSTSMAEILVISINPSYTDIATLTESLSALILKTTEDTANAVEYSIFSIGSNLSAEAVAVTEDSVINFQKTDSDEIGIAIEDYAINANSVQIEATAATEEISLDINTMLFDTVVAADTLLLSNLQAVNDSFIISETANVEVGINKLETITSTEIISNEITAIKEDTSVVIDTVQLAVTSFKVDVTAISETLSATSSDYADYTYFSGDYNGTSYILI